MQSSARKTRWPLILLIAIGGAAPPAFYWAVFYRVPSVTPDEAKAMLSKPGSRTMLVDIRDEDVFGKAHLAEAVNWPYGSIVAMSSLRGLPEELQGRTLLLICDGGMHSALATRKLRGLAASEVLNVRGGMQGWIGSAKKPCPLEFATLRTGPKTTAPLPFRKSPLYEQLLVVVTGFGIKPAYMLLSLILAGVLWRQRSPDLTALRWAMISFFLGEAFCAANYFIYNEDSYLFEYLHSYGMVLTFGFTTYAFFEGLDCRIVHYTEPEKRCAALGPCRSCIKYADVPCGLRRLIPAHVILALMPLGTVPRSVAYNTEIFGAPYTYVHLAPHQLFESRYCPLAAVLLFAASFLVLLLKKNDPVHTSKVLFASGMGPFAFGMMRLFLFGVYTENLLWFIVWEELTELLYVAGVAVILWLFPGVRPRPGGEGETRNLPSARGGTTDTTGDGTA